MGIMIKSNRLWEIYNLLFCTQFLGDPNYRVSGAASSRAHGEIENAAALIRRGKLKQLVLLNWAVDKTHREHGVFGYNRIWLANMRRYNSKQSSTKFLSGCSRIPRNRLFVVVLSVKQAQNWCQRAIAQGIKVEKIWILYDNCSERTQV